MPFGKEGGMPCATIWNLNNVQRRVLQRSTGVWEKASRGSREHSLSNRIQPRPPFASNHAPSRGVERAYPCSA
jgi:hypothetical protein